MHVKNLIKQFTKILVILLFVFSASYSYAAVPAGYSEYFIPGDEVSMWTIFNSLDAAATTTMHTVISVTAWSANTKVYYDHWESCKGIPVGSVGCTNGYNFDPDNPDATADEIVTLTNAGDQRVFESSNIPTNPRGTTTYYDGGDRIYVAGGSVTVTRASWIEAVGVGNQADAWEIYPVKPQLTTYTVPFGENLGFTDFSRVYALIQATEDNTTFTVDLNGDGTPDMLNINRNAIKSLADGDMTTISLSKGQTFLLDRISACTTNLTTCTTNPGNLNSGTVIQGNKTLQVKFVAGNPGQRYSARGFSAFPRGFWTKDYYAPVDEPSGGTIHTDYYLYNPNSAAITISWSSVSTSGTFAIPAKSTVSFRTASGVSVPVNSGLYFKGSDVFWGVGVGDAGGNAYEWGYSLLPSTMLYNEHFLGWAPGSSPLDTTGNPGNQDNDGVFLIAAQDNTRIWVDFDGDGVSDLIDADGDGTPESSYVTLNRLQTQFFYDPANAAGGGDLSKAHFWGTGSFMLAYGENADTATTSSPSLDLGYVGIPSTDFVSLVLTVDKSVSPQVVSTASGSQATFTIKVNSKKYTIDGVAVTDYLPASWQYVTDSAIITQPGLTQVTGSAANPTITGTGPYTLSWSSVQVGGNMLENQEITITFRAQTTAVLAAGTLSQNRVKAVGTRTFGSPLQTQTFTATDFVYVASESSTGLTITKTSVADPLVPGQQFPYTVTLNNQSSTTLTGISIYDPLPSGLSYVASSGSVSCELSVGVKTVLDQFGTQAYNNNNGTTNWATNWTETDIYGNGATGATGGFVWATGSQLQFRYLLPNVSDNFDTAGTYSGNNNSTYNWDAGWTETNDDNSATTGSIVVTGGYARFRQGTAGRSISRTVTFAGATSATINFTLTDNGIDAGETMVAEYSIDGGAYVTIGTLDGNTGWSGSVLPLTIALTNNNTITLQFRAPQAWNQTNDEAHVDNVNITFTTPVIGTQIQRTANLTGAVNPMLSFTSSAAGVEAGDTLVLEASTSPAGPFTTLATSNGNVSGGALLPASPYNLTPYISGTTTIRFRVTGGYNATNETFSIDNVQINNLPLNTFASGSPPDFLLRSAGCSIRPSNSLTLTYNVTVDDPLATGIDKIINTAYINSNQIILPLSASVTNTVVNPSSQSATVGDRVWFDINGNGVLDVGEPGLANVEVTLKDQYGTPLMTTTTDATGHYLFTGVQPGNGYYVEVTSSTLPSGLQQSAPSGHTDNRSNSFNLTSGQSYTNADLGYSSDALTASFGNQVWVDANSDQIRNAGEVGLGGITVKLYLDNNSNGLIDIGTDTLIGTTTTAPDGTYLFTGATASGTQDYLVSATTPTGYLPTVATLFRYVDVTAGTTLLNADFGFVGNTVTTYTIKDRIWVDTDGDGVFDAGENGIAGVTIDLLDASLNVLGTTTTAADGTLTFSGLAGGGADYTIKVTDTNSKLANYFGTTSAAISGTKQIINVFGNVDYSATPSFGYNISRSIGGTIFNDLGGTNGVQDSGEPGIAGVVVSLYKDINGDGIINGPGDALLGSITTDAAGQYLFSGLVDRTYIVSVPIPAGYSFIANGAVNPDTDGTAAGIQNKAAMAGGVNVLDKNFGFRAATARTVSGTIWYDLDADGLKDFGEQLLAGVTLEVRRNCPAPCTLVATVTTVAGAYSVAGLVNDNSYTVRVTDINSVLTDYTATFEYDVGTAGPFDNQAAVDLTISDVDNVNFGFYKLSGPTRVTLSDFRAYEQGGRVYVRWETAYEHNTLGFNLLRLDSVTGKYKAVNSGLMPGIFKPHHGGIYTLIDGGALPGGTYTYRLIEVENTGERLSYGPFTVSIGSNDGGETVISRPSGYDRKYKEDTEHQKARMKTRNAALTAVRSGTETASGDRIKISVPENGVYYLDAGDISSLLGLSVANVSSMISRGQLSLSSQGKQAAYMPAANNAGIYFYGAGIDSIYTKENIYWLEKGKGIIMTVLPGRRPRPSSDEESFTETQHFEQNLSPWETLFNDPEADYWFWWQLFAEPSTVYTDPPKDFDFEAPGLSKSQNTAKIKLKLFGGSDAGVANDHHVVVSLNGVKIDDYWWSALNPYTITFTAPINTVVNTLTVEGIADPGVSASSVFINSFDVTYQRLYEASGDRLAFRGDGHMPVTVGGFTSPDIMVFDVTNPLIPKLNAATTVGPDTTGYSVSLNPASASTPYFSVTGSEIQRLSGKAVGAFSLSSRNNAADYIIIAPFGLISAAQVLADYRKTQGYKTMVVDIENIMNEFNYGIPSPEAIKKFLSYAYSNWKTAPRYVVLAGDGSMDYKDNLGLGYGGNLIPSRMVPTSSGLFVSDNYLADFNGDHVPEIAIGRLPVIAPDELLTVINKIKTYESVPGNKKVVLLADTPDVEAGDFISDSEALEAVFPAGYTFNRIYLYNPADIDAARDALFAAINNGAAFFNYVGHAGPNQLSNSYLSQLSNSYIGLINHYTNPEYYMDDLPLFTNAGVLPVMTAMTCLVGNFSDPYQSTLTEALVLKAGGGVVATWAPTGLSDDAEASILNREFYMAFFISGGKPAIGDVVRKALSAYKSQGTMPFMMDIYNILGDPALRMR
jgi:uncharacterized repeat protein (TIGR01451 family)